MADEGQKKGGRPENIEKKPQLSKAERRAKQEAQRAAKEAERAAKGLPPTGQGKPKADGAPAKSSGKSSTVAAEKTKPNASTMQHDDAKKVQKNSKKQIIQRVSAQKQVDLFSHLAQYERESTLDRKVGFSSDKAAVHPAALRLGLKYAEGAICGANARCVAMLEMFKTVINDFTPTDDKPFTQQLYSHIGPVFQVLTDCRYHANSMGNAFKWLKNEIGHIDTALPRAEVQEMLVEKIDNYINTRITVPGIAISESASNNIQDGDVVLTYASSSLVQKTLLKAYEGGKKFRVVIVDSRPKMEGKTLLKTLSNAGISCTYILINAVSYIMKEVSKVILGAAAMFNTGSLLSRVGTGAVAMMANAYNVPVIVCCETYKFCERSHIDSICYNELGDPDELVSLGRTTQTNYLSEWRDLPNLHLLHLLYDVTPADYIDVVVCEAGMIPSSSVPVIMREYNSLPTLI